jgi:hypothetical protein
LSMDATNSSRNFQVATRTLTTEGWTAAETKGNKNIKDVNSSREARNSGNASNSAVETPNTVLASAWTETAKEMPDKVWTPITHLAES